MKKRTYIFSLLLSLCLIAGLLSGCGSAAEESGSKLDFTDWTGETAIAVQAKGEDSSYLASEDQTAEILDTITQASLAETGFLSGNGRYTLTLSADSANFGDYGYSWTDGITLRLWKNGLCVNDELYLKTTNGESFSALFDTLEEVCHGEDAVPGTVEAGCLVDAQSKEARSIVMEVVELSEQEILERTALGVVGTVTDSQVIEILPVGGGDSALYTEYTLSIEEVLRGETAADTLTFRVQGGETDTRLDEVTPCPTFSQGEQVLLCLYQPGMGNWYNTEGDYYYIVGVDQGVYREEALAAARETLLNDGPAVPLNESWFADSYHQREDELLANGEITQEEYDAAQEAAETYAKLST